MLRSGPRITARGRQISANAAPISNPVERVIVDRYSVSVFEIGAVADVPELVGDR